MSQLAGTARLLRLNLRRDRVLLTIWVVSIGVLTALVVTSLAAVYATEEERAAGAAFSASQVATRIFDGAASGTTQGAMVMVEAYIVLAILVALMSAQTVIRHTRQDEETGRAELLEASIVGRHARLTAALLAALLANLVVTATAAIVLLAHGLPVAGSIVSGLSVGAIGLTFAAVGAVTAQLSATQRGANGLAGAVLGLFFMLRALGDAFGTVAESGVELTSAWPTWLSPMGWGQQVRPFHQDNIEIFGLFSVAIVALIALAFVLTSNRDVGASMFAPKPGPARASDSLRTPLGLAWRMQRGPLVAWLLGLGIVGALLGAVGDSTDDFLDASEGFGDLLLDIAPGAEVVDLYFAFMTGFLAIAASAYTVQALLRMRGEEHAGRLEPLLATAVSRRRWLSGHMLIATTGTLALLLTIGVAGGIGYLLAGGEPEDAWGMLQAAAVNFPAALAVAGFLIAVFAYAPRWVSTLAWSAVAFNLVVGQLGDTLNLPQVIHNIAPFTHVPTVPATPMTWLPVTILVVIGAGLAAVGAHRFTNRDLVIPA